MPPRQRLGQRQHLPALGRRVAHQPMQHLQHLRLRMQQTATARRGGAGSLPPGRRAPLAGFFAGFPASALAFCAFDLSHGVCVCVCVYTDGAAGNYICFGLLCL